MSLIQDDLVKVAYKKFKQMVYFEKTQLFTRKRLAEFECSKNFEERLDKLGTLIMKEGLAETAEFREWLNEISFVLLPKAVKPAEPHSKNDGTFVTNVSSEDHYKVEKVNYFFDGPIELHLIAVLWLMIDGPKLDRGLAKNCLGSRLHTLVGDDDDHSAQLFQKYHEQYAKWRDDGIKKARALLIEEERSVCIIALDLQEYYYRLQIDWEKLETAIARPQQRKNLPRIFYERDSLGERLLGCIKTIFESYRERISTELSITHSLPENAICLPIGLCASQVIGNWYLKRFDKAILSKVRPAYYGRYVDDILLVVASESVPAKDPILGFMDEVLVNAGVLNWHEETERYEVNSRPGLFLQKKKCILQFFEAHHSIAGLEKFRKELEQNASDFALLPVEGDDSPVEQVAYDILYDGSVNKLRSIKAIAENRWELAKHLSKQTQLYLVAGGRIEERTKKELFRFFKGRNAIDYWDMWERVIAFLLIGGDAKSVDEFSNAMKDELKKVRYISSSTASSAELPKISTKLRLALINHLELSLEVNRAVRVELTSNNSSSSEWRASNLIRHHLVSVPLLNYSDFNGDLALPGNASDVKLDQRKIQLSPRFVHFDECMGLVDSGFSSLAATDTVQAANKIYSDFHGSKVEGVSSKVVGLKRSKSK